MALKVGAYPGKSSANVHRLNQAVSMLFDLPFTTYDQARELGYKVGLSCTGCHHKIDVDLSDLRLAGKRFAGGVRFRCSNFIKRWTASPGYTCGHLAHVKLYPTGDLATTLDQRGILYSSLGCSACEPTWSFHQARQDDPLWHALTDKRFQGLSLSDLPHGVLDGLAWPRHAAASLAVGEGSRLMVGPWPHRPGTLRALITILRSCHIICRPCQRYAPLSAEHEDLDRPAEPCPFVCSQCGARCEIVMSVPVGFALTPIAAKPPKPPETDPPPLGPWHTPSF